MVIIKKEEEEEEEEEEEKEKRYISLFLLVCYESDVEIKKNCCIKSRVMVYIGMIKIINGK